jgi:hypothetical protein
MRRICDRAAPANGLLVMDTDRPTISDRDTILALVKNESARFRAKIPQLIPLYKGKWVVFRDDAVVSVHPDEESAYVAGLKQFGPGGGHVVAVVREPESILLRASIAFGL